MSASRPSSGANGTLSCSLSFNARVDWYTLQAMFITTDGAGPQKLNFGRRLQEFAPSAPQSNKDSQNEDKRRSYATLLEKDPRAVLKSAEKGDVDALYAFHCSQTDFKEDLLVDLFRIVSMHLNPQKLEAIAKPSKAVVRKNQKHAPDAPKEESAMLKLAFASLAILGSPKMYFAVKARQSAFTSLISKHWPNTFSSLKVLYTLHSSGEFTMPITKMRFASLVCRVVMVVFQNGAALQRLMVQAPVQKLLWTMWLYGGPTKYGQDDQDEECAAASAIAKLLISLKRHDVLLTQLRQVSGQFGGDKTIAEIALAGVYGALTCQNKDDDRILDVKQHAFVLTTIICKDHGMQEIYNADGIAMLIEGLTELLTDKRSKLAEPGMPLAVEILLKCIEQLATRGYRYIEQAARCGLLQLFVELKPSKGDLNDQVLGIATTFLDILPRYLVYHSVIGSFGEEMRKLTEGKYPEDACLIEGQLSGPWRELKRVLLDRYCSKRYYDIVVAPTSNVRYCNNCGGDDDREKFMACSGCKQTFYCSKDCQVEDWKLKGHREECKQGSTRYIHDVPFLCFLANQYVNARVEHVGASLKKAIAPERAVYRLDFCCETIEPILDLRDAKAAKVELRCKTSGVVEGATYMAKNEPRVRSVRSQGRSIEDVEEAPDNAQIELTVFDGIQGPIVRYIKLVSGTYFMDVVGGVDLLCPCCTDRVRVGVIDPNGYLIPGKRDVVDLIFAEVHTRDKDSWMCRSNSRNIFGQDEHVFDAIDRYIRSCLNIKFGGFEL